MGKIVIIGNGISGITAARHIRKKSDYEIVVISAETEHFFSRTALMYVFMGHMRYEDIKPYEDWFWEKNRIDLLFDYVTDIHTTEKMLKTRSGQKVNYDKLILATGSKPNKFGWPGQDLKGVQGLYSYQDLELIEENSKDARKAIIVGGGLIGVELAEMLITRNIEVTILVRDGRFWGNVLPKQEASLIQKHIAEHHVDVRLKTELAEIIGDDHGRAKAVKTNQGEEIACDIVGLTAGVSPNIEFLRSTNIELDRGILVDAFLQTNIQDIYAIGDCAQFREPVKGRRAIEQVWYTGRIMGETVAETICNQPLAYNPGPWFNSAKFFDIEYQTYGWVMNELQEGESEFYWEHPNGKMAMHFIWDKASDVFKGINTFGIRLRHELFDQWLKEDATIDTVMSQLRSANFDPELYRRFESDIIEQFNQTTGKEVQLKPKKWWRKALART